ncbi:arylsulfatase A family protein [Candidatus Halobonum tyrrellensis G22]|uniref:Arylsulfatase A family protein n=1 Tax=Candidatus Halobonum tyrrellensis G22 TaxID=1324957 RepID=V4HJR8_9EURY|nr:arylsulfatase A family protein [Candidatus Halobonum tyrrellensis G22]
MILLSADALRADHLSCYGYHRDTSPVLDEFAEESVRFTNAYSASSHTREAVPALLTGEFPDVAVGADYRLATETVASTFAEAGYATGGFHSNPYVSRAYGFDRGFDEFDDDLHLGRHKLVALAQRALDKLRNRHYARAAEINDRALSWLDSLGDEPFFLWNHYMDTHGPYEPPGEYATLYRESEVSDRDAQSLYRRAIREPESITPDERDLLVNLYDAEIRYNDEKIGEFLDALRERGLLERSLVVVTADHGDAFGEHGYYEHPRYLHDETTHVPLFVRPPGGADGETVSTPASTLDVAATFEQLLGRDVGAGRASLLDRNETDRTVFLQARGEDDHADVRRYAAKTREGSCYCERDRESGAVEFGDSGRDLRSDLEAHVDRRVRAENGEGGPEGEAETEEIERRLSALGYKE